MSERMRRLHFETVLRISYEELMMLFLTKKNRCLK